VLVELPSATIDAGRSTTETIAGRPGGTAA
jgi:hypothetical protein